MPPASIAGVLAALEVIEEEPERREQLWRNTRRMQEGLRSLGYDIGKSDTPIIPVLIGDLERMLVFWKELFDAGVFTNPVTPPAVPENSCRLRISCMATHTDEHIDFARLQSGKALLGGGRRELYLGAVAEDRGRDRAAIVDVEAGPFALVVRRGKAGQAGVDAALQEALRLDVLECRRGSSRRCNGQRSNAQHTGQ